MRSSITSTAPPSSSTGSQRCGPSWCCACSPRSCASTAGTSWSATASRSPSAAARCRRSSSCISSPTQTPSQNTSWDTRCRLRACWFRPPPACSPCRSPRASTRAWSGPIATAAPCSTRCSLSSESPPSNNPSTSSPTPTMPRTRSSPACSPRTTISSEADPERSNNKQTSLFNVLAESRQSRVLEDRRDFQSGGCVISAAAILSRVCEANEDHAMAWTEITRRKYQRDELRYASDTADEEWRVIEPHLPPPARCGRTRATSLRDVVDAIFYIAQTGCQWRLLPKDFPPYTTVQRYFYAWRDNGVWQTINHVLLMDVRQAAGREASPS